ncbi:MAG: hypothetical protein ACKOWF_10895, partial [Chloroflexota bacterium]
MPGSPSASPAGAPGPFPPAGWLADLDGDGLPDEIAVRLVLPPAAPEDVLLAAAELAARLGLESMGMTLPLAAPAAPADGDGPAVVVRLAGAAGEAQDAAARDGDRLTVEGSAAAVAAALRDLARSGSAAGQAAPDLPLAPAAAGLAPLDLADLFAPGQLLADLDGDLVPDAAACLLVPEGLPGDALGPALCHAAARLGLESAGLSLPLAGPRALRFRAGDGRLAAVPGPDGAEDLVIEGAAAADWLAAAAPGPADDAHQLARTIRRIRRALAREDAPPAPGAVLREEVRELPWEVDEAREIVRREVMPRVRPGSAVALDLRVSETRAIREALRDELAGLLAAAGAAPEVTVRAVGKAGLCWLREEVAPRLAEVADAALVIRCQPFASDPGEEWVSADAIHELRLIDPARADELQARVDRDGRGSLWKEPPIRWLLELYPVDELLPIPPEQVTFDLVPGLASVYEAEIRDGTGALREVLRFDPRWTERPWLDAFPELGMVHPPTGWIAASVDGETVADRRIETDAERAWEVFQSEVLPALGACAREVSGGRLDPASQPFFGALELHLEASEPDEDLEVREERASSLEALHEDFYFVALEHMRRLGEREGEGGEKLDAPGQVIPWLHERPGRGARLRWRLTGAPRAAVPAGAPAARVTEVRVDAAGALVACRVEVALPEAAAAPAAREALAPLAGRLPVAAACGLACGGAPLEVLDLP